MRPTQRLKVSRTVIVVRIQGRMFQGKIARLTAPALGDQLIRDIEIRLELFSHQDNHAPNRTLPSRAGCRGRHPLHQASSTPRLAAAI